jgi:hypothetical protein
MEFSMSLFFMFEIGNVLWMISGLVVVIVLFVLLRRQFYSISLGLTETIREKGFPDVQQPLDENVQFTVYRPRAVEPERWYTFIVYAHLSERRFGTPSSEPHPREQVDRMAREALGEKLHAYSEGATDSRQAIPQEGVLVFLPVIEGIEFLPERETILWEGPLHELKFKMRAQRKLEGKTARGSLQVSLGIFLVAEMPLTILVDTGTAREYGEAPAELGETVSPYRKIFASYSHEDELMVVQFERLAEVFGDRYLRDVRDIRAGEVWNKRLEELIRDADVFQLFWSWKSMKSKFVRNEWEYALSLNKPSFIRTTFWEEPMPSDESEGLPPEALLRLQFKKAPNYIQPPKQINRLRRGTIVTLMALLICAVLAPFLGSSLFVHRASSNEASAQASLRTIFSAEGVYFSTVGEGKFGTLAELGANSLIDPSLAQGKKGGYIFTVNIDSKKGEPQFEALAEPETSERGSRSFYIDERGILFQKKGLKAGSRGDPGSPL